MMAERHRTVSVGGGDCESDIGGMVSDLFSSSIHSEPSLMNTSTISTSSQDSQRLLKPSHNLQSKKIGSSICRFPKLEECAHFHYERVQLGQVLISLVDDKPEIITSGNSNQGDMPQHWFITRVSAGRSEPFLIKRSLQNLILLDEMLHRCVYDRRISDLQDLANVGDINDDEELEDIVSIYLSRLSSIASDAMTCGPVLTWFQLDNKGRRLPVADNDTMITINTPAVGAAYGIRRYAAQACDEISIEVGDMISVIDMPSPAESLWWRGKKNHFQKNQYEVGFFPQNCVATIGEKVPRHMPLPAPLVGSLAVSPTKPVLRKHGKLITFFRSFIVSRPSRRRLKQSGIYKERVFSCDLGEHLMNSGLDIPMVLKCCAEFIEEYGIVDGVYRLSGITSNIQKLRRAFDEEIIPDLSQPDIRQDIHAVTSLLKMYFRELPNPLCTYQLYDNFVEAIQAKSDVEDSRLKMIKQTVRKLPPPHYRTLKYLACHLNRIAKHSNRTGMTERNIAIVWAPNLLRSPALESGGVAALRGVGVQAVVTEYLIVNSVDIFDDCNDEADNLRNSQPPSLSDTSSIHMDARDLSLSLIERPKSLGIGPPKLISLEEAQIRKKEKEIEKGLPMVTSTHNACSSYIEVGGGPASLPDKYHTVLPVPRSWNKRKTHSWKSIFQRGDRRSTSSVIKSKFISNPIAKENVDKNEIKESIKVLPVIKSASNSNNSSFKEKTKLTKSADTLDTGPRSLTVDVSCPRSCSIDSLRTPGHSRSVSHDSYFDLLQSPLRAGMTTTCPSRELSELGLNFDREELEMRLLSESESLVSSPKVAKDTVPRRVLRARPEEYSNTTNSVNPSPKKQPRLNLASPGELKTWASIISEATNESSKDDDESSCKRSKLEDQLSDIQFIDCNTPEHSITSNANVNTGYTIYTQIQIHNPPSIFSDRQEQHKTIINTTSPAPSEVNERYSYPVTQYTTFAQQSKKDERFSYPIAISTKENSTAEKNDEHVHKMSISESPPTVTKKESPVRNQMIVQDVQRSASADQMTKSKLSIQSPPSPMKSPVYSLLIGSTASSATPSPVNTPTYDMDICNHYEPIEFSAKEVVIRQATEEKKNDMSLDLKNRISITSPETSQSMTPSEIGYQNLYNRQFSVTPELEEIVKPTIVMVPSPPRSPQSSGNVSPQIKSTINITYNIKSPKGDSDDSQKFFGDDAKKEGLLETSFDDTMVYEQVKFFKNAVEQVNDMVDEKIQIENPPPKDEAYAEDQYEVVFKNDKVMMMSDIQMQEGRAINLVNEQQIEEVKVEFDHEVEAQDSLEFDQNMSLYENVEVKKPEKVYENVPLPSSLTNSPVKQLRVTFDKNCSNDELESGSKVEESRDFSITNVRKLATKFETSPIDVHPSYDINNSPSRKSEVQLRKTSRNPDLYTITRSLDENAFIREFGSAKKFEEFNKSINEIADLANRRKSIDYSKPKSLNQPKKLPGLQPSSTQEKHDHCKKSTLGDVEHKLKLNVTNEDDYVDTQKSPSINSERTPLQNFNVRITPTTENRISLIQSNFEEKKLDDGKSTSLSNLKALKLDRERIEKIKEERRHQLNEKYRSDSFRNLNNNVKITKDKSKTELDIDDFQDDISINNQRFKTKIQTNYDQPSSLTSTSSSSITNLTTNVRTRRISDEKNQNDLDSGSDDQVFLRKKESDESSNEGGRSDSRSRVKNDRRVFEPSRERNCSSGSLRFSQSSNQTERYSPQISIKDVAAIFESRASQKQTN